MITLVIGKANSGKSDVAEDLAVKGDYKNRYYKSCVGRRK